jgi:hypothetical protein
MKSDQAGVNRIQEPFGMGVVFLVGLLLRRCGTRGRAVGPLRLGFRALLSLLGNSSSRVREGASAGHAHRENTMTAPRASTWRKWSCPTRKAWRLIQTWSFARSSLASATDSFARASRYRTGSPCPGVEWQVCHQVFSCQHPNESRAFGGEVFWCRGNGPLIVQWESRLTSRLWKITLAARS